MRFNQTDLHAPNYHVMGLDLRNLDEIQNKLKHAEVDFTIPTLFLAECVLVYIEPDHCDNLLKWLASQFKSAVFVNYEQVGEHVSSTFRHNSTTEIFTTISLSLSVG